jgi:hypothetical protein
VLGLGCGHADELHCSAASEPAAGPAAAVPPAAAAAGPAALATLAAAAEVGRCRFTPG